MGRDPGSGRRAANGEAAEPSGRRAGAGGRRGAFAGLAGVLVWALLAGRAGAQAPTVDTSVPGLPGSAGSSMGPPPGGGLLGAGDVAGIGRERRGVPTCPAPGCWAAAPGRANPKGIPGSITTPGRSARARPRCSSRSPPPQPQPVGPTTSPFAGTLDLPSTEDDGPPDGLTLDQAIDVTLERSLDLRQKFIEIPMARADILQANLRANPVFYQDGQLLQYQRGEFNRSRPGGPQQFDTNITYPLDISQKRRARTDGGDPRPEGARGPVPGRRP